MSKHSISAWVTPAIAHLMMGSITIAATPLDSSFGEGGVASMLVGSHATNLHEIALQSNGRIVMCGRALNNVSSGSYGYDVALVRFLADGSPDPSFGVDGKVSTDIGSSYPFYTDESGSAVLVQPDNKIVVAGTTRRYKKGGSASFEWYQWDVLLLRYMEDGTLDGSFGTDGRVIIDIKGTGTIPEGFNDVALQSDNKIIGVGYTYPGNNRFLIMRFLPDGTVDTSFGASGTGVVEEHFAPNYIEDAYNVLVLPDDSIVVVGRGIKPDLGANATLSMLKLTSGGILDTSFNGTGKIAMSVGVSSYGLGLATDAVGRILVSGYDEATSSSDQRALILRYNSDGSLDPTFNGTGIFTTTSEDYVDLRMNDVAVEDGGTIIGVGVADSPTSKAIVRIRLNEDGTADETFAPGGMATTTLDGASYYSVGNCALQSDGKLLVGAPLGGIDDAVLRYTVSEGETRPDGIPTDWIITHYGSNENAPQEVVKGGRVVSLLDAYLLGENPLDPNDFVRIQKLTLDGDGLSIELPTLVGRAYQIESSPDMSSDSWDPVGERIIGDAMSADVILPKGSPRKFYRVVISRP